MPTPKPRPRRSGSLMGVLLIVALGAVIALVAQQTLAEETGGFLGGIVVAVIGAVIALIAALFGGVG